ncbi:MAG: hypothetical protein JKY22_00345 [Flavobacteriaceae bacterium]|nr:hypothetical protein [Flavobacteriaceae bacterium]PCJ29013.1 MAG: hypothetical protein COA94_02935 [Rickettsiales bacterium]
MGANQVNVSKSTQELQNDILQVTEENCHAKCTNYDGGGTVIIDGTNIKGDLDIVQQCTASASCTMNQTLQSQVEDIMSSISKQSQKSEQSFINFTISNQADVSEIKQNITNSITQIMQSSCQATSDNIQKDNIVILRNDTVGGDFTLGQKGSASSNCILNNVAKQVLFNKQQAKQDQSQTAENVLAIIVVAIVIGIIALGLFALFFFGKKILGSSSEILESPNSGEKGKVGNTKKKSSGLFSKIGGLLEADPELLLL